MGTFCTAYWHTVCVGEQPHPHSVSTVITVEIFQTMLRCSKYFFTMNVIHRAELFQIEQLTKSLSFRLQV